MSTFDRGWRPFETWRIRTAAREHLCEVCEGTIAKGERYIEIVFGRAGYGQVRTEERKREHRTCPLFVIELSAAVSQGLPPDATTNDDYSITEGAAAIVALLKKKGIPVK